jgi:hypothetical protein
MYKQFFTFFLLNFVIITILKDYFNIEDYKTFIVVQLFPATTLIFLKLFLKKWLSIATINENEFEYKPKYVPVVFIFLFSIYFSFFVLSIITGSSEQIFDFHRDKDFLKYFLSFFIIYITSFLIIPFLLDIIGKFKIGHISKVCRNIVENYFFYERITDSKIYTTIEGIEFDRYSIKAIEKLYPGTPRNRASVISDLRHRANKLLLINAFILSFIVVVLVVAAIFIVFAGEIASRDTQSLSLMQTTLDKRQKMNSEIDKLEEELSEVSADLANQNKKADSLIDKINLLSVKSDLSDSESLKLKELNDDLNELLAKNTKKTAIKNLIESKKMRKYDDLKRYDELLTSLKNKAIESGEAKFDTVTGANLLIAAGITRFGVLAITIYLVQILLNLYRYNTRVSSFYMSRSDALILIDHSSTEISDISDILMPAVDFGKQPSTLPEKFTEKIGAIIDKTLSEVIKTKNK